ncbi:MAG: hypothetical protein IJV04_03520 [Lachnospiraceae bacterium]|nr:hypothetical protein [Lachnospiraceae bacterium]
MLEATGARIVLSSSWRKGYYDHAAGHDTDDARDYLLLEEALAAIGGEIIGYTPMFDTAYRGTEILAWLREHRDLDVEAILILDDDKDMKPLGSFLIRTSFVFGLSEKHVAGAIDLLMHDAYTEFVRGGGLDQDAQAGSAAHSSIKV